MMLASHAFGIWCASILCGAWLGRRNYIARRDLVAMLVVAGIAGTTSVVLAILSQASAITAP